MFLRQQLYSLYSSLLQRSQLANTLRPVPLIGTSSETRREGTTSLVELRPYRPPGLHLVAWRAHAERTSADLRIGGVAAAASECDTDLDSRPRNLCAADDEDDDAHARAAAAPDLESDSASRRCFSGGDQTQRVRGLAQSGACVRASGAVGWHRARSLEQAGRHHVFGGRGGAPRACGALCHRGPRPEGGEDGRAGGARRRRRRRSF